MSSSAYSTKESVKSAKKPLMRQLAMSKASKKLDKKTVDCKLRQLDPFEHPTSHLSNAHENVKVNGSTNRQR